MRTHSRRLQRRPSRSSMLATPLALAAAAAIGALGIPSSLVLFSLIRSSKALQQPANHLLKRARARHCSTARSHFVELTQEGGSLFDVAGAIAEEENPRFPRTARARVDELVKLTAARMALSSLAARPKTEAERVAEAVAATLADLGATKAGDPCLDEPYLMCGQFFDGPHGASPPAVLAVVGEVARAASNNAVTCAGVEGGSSFPSAVLRDEGGGTASVSVRRGPKAAPRKGSTPRKAEPPLRQSTLLLKGLQSTASARGDLVRLVAAADRILLLARLSPRTVTVAEWQDAAVDVASCVVALDWTERRAEAKALLNEALKGEWSVPQRSAVKRGLLLREHAFFAEA